MMALQAFPTRTPEFMIVLRFTPVMRPISRMLEPSQSIDTTETFFSNGSLFAISIV